jgi:hypothetical protein
MVTTEEQMRSMIETKQPKARRESKEVPEGLSLTRTSVSDYWYYREGPTIAVMHERLFDGRVCFYVESNG